MEFNNRGIKMLDDVLVIQREMKIGPITISIEEYTPLPNVSKSVHEAQTRKAREALSSEYRLGAEELRDSIIALERELVPCLRDKANDYVKSFSLASLFNPESEDRKNFLRLTEKLTHYENLLTRFRSRLKEVSGQNDYDHRVFLDTHLKSGNMYKEMGDQTGRRIARDSLLHHLENSLVMDSELIGPYVAGIMELTTEEEQEEVVSALKGE
jgi:hypothetical protein